MASGRDFFVGGNWKMNGSKASIDEILHFLKEAEVPENTGKLIIDTAAMSTEGSEPCAVCSMCSILNLRC